MNIEKRKTFILNCIKSARKGRNLEELINYISYMDELEDQELDIALIKGMGDFTNNGLYGSFDDTWRWDIGRIAKAKCPLEKLPEHVRSIAQKLYYQKSEKKA